ncbi:hypothetical protein ABZS71_29565 [Streptomyces sp. NPDC005393]|uniref:hypothetical protein n=1 Tax=Streptomyces sp. NPDC005393 TaxID=3157041 RepID=UPI0033BB1B42
MHTDTQTTNSLIRGIRALGERAAAELKQRWRTLQHVTISPSRIADIARAALVLVRPRLRSASSWAGGVFSQSRPSRTVKRVGWLPSTGK